ncbi:bifunctional metallophosphatase/5'-nucleotidase [Altererythrobacter arenosus]|uniref:Bifunctional metallophosphatase/5'-nucleotidase n=1 Tax=Altererythrobacter arenosus TaxID=3032592 RepID=A0ABY8FTT9_9SPHN|nr:bifunctional metallophosphatase/5'-nucleotidase [Altererythrobacter sp. CAU 1644]WFL78419.1 bifunctional metallophosphatase/5'-nucleotidase [Altererythrobacter sp. CAU 1644]
MKQLAPLLAALALGACATLPEAPSAAPEPVTLRVIGLNDFHGNLEPLRRPYTVPKADGSTEQVQVGGLAAYSAVIDSLRRQNDHSLVIAAGDMINASPLVSSLFLDEPTVTGLGNLGVDFSAVGNHEFDRGWRELRRMQDGGCEKFSNREPCQVEPFKGASFQILAAGTQFEDGGEPLFPGSAIRSFGEGEARISVGVIGLTLEDTPNLVTPSGVDGLEFADEALAINAEVEKLAQQGVDAVIVAIHQGLYSDRRFDDPGCEGINGPLLDILARVDPRVDLVLSGHTHQFYVCDYSEIDPARSFLVTSAGYGGAFVTDIALTIDPVASDVTASSARNVMVRADGSTTGTLDAAADAYVAVHAEAARAIAERSVGRITGDGRFRATATEETPLGNAIADAQLLATRDAGAQIAFMNNSGIRAALTPRADGTVTFADVYTVQPFGNTLVTKSFTGAQLLALLEQQFDDEGFVQTFSPSEGFVLTYDMRRPVGSRVVNVTLDGKPIDPAATYRVTMNSFLAGGGDSFSVFTQGTEATVGPLDLEAMELWLAQGEVRALPPTGRVTRLDSGQ